ncbi:DMT family transporter [Palaeococcus sp. (in: euryarchaeotes)]
MKNQKMAYIYGISAVLMWSTVASAFKLSLQHLDYMNLVFYASLTSTIVLLLMIIKQRKLTLFRENLNLRRSLILGFINPFLYYLVLFKAYSLLPAQEAQALNYTWPIILAFLSIPLLNQKISFRGILAIFVSFFGVLIIATRGDVLSLNFRNPMGTLLGLGSAFIWASYWILNLRDEREDVLKLFLNFTFGFIYITLFIWLFGKFQFSFEGIMGSVYIGLFEMGITFLVWHRALSLSRTTAQVANLIYLTPFISLLFIHLIVGEEILPSTLIGLIFIVGGILMGREK